MKRTVQLQDGVTVVPCGAIVVPLWRRVVPLWCLVVALWCRVVPLWCRVVPVWCCGAITAPQLHLPPDRNAIVLPPPCRRTVIFLLLSRKQLLLLICVINCTWGGFRPLFLDFQPTTPSMASETNIHTYTN